MVTAMSSHLDHGHSHEPLDPPRVEEVAENVFAYIQPDGTWWINNTGFLVASDGVVAFDTCATERRTRLFLDHVREITAAPIRVVVNTHHHGDHTHGNYLTHPATIVGHERCRSAMIESGIVHYPGVFGDPPPSWGDLELAPPMLTFAERMNVHAGDIHAELHYIGTPAHTDNDVVGWLPDQKVLFAGDLVFNGGTPFVLMGSVSGAIKAVDAVRAFGAETIVPGHGPVCDASILDSLTRYFEFVQAVATDAHHSGVAPLEAALETDLGEFAELSDHERLVGNLHRAMYEIGGGEPGGSMDLGRPIADMLAFNNGQPLRCLA